MSDLDLPIAPRRTATGDSIFLELIRLLGCVLSVGGFVFAVAAYLSI
ncbi:hypothetical protein LCGC14_0188050 [marine sediment metagenome]|uniref:Uncharacterized protein n=1 Tax=marine sediment metagenome TaxID=412755 RepID=A0A0F9V441_9ZZZZ